MNGGSPPPTESLAVLNPATGEELGRTPLSPAAEVDAAAQAARRAFPGWRRVPVTERIQYLFKLKSLLEEQFEDLSRAPSRMECGKTLGESRGEMRRAIENVEVACGTPILIQGYNSEDIAAGIDEMMIRQPLGVCAIIAPFNFPGMIPFWFLPYAMACGNTVLVKPSERVPLTMQKVFELLDGSEAAAGGRQPRERRARSGRRHPRSPDRSARSASSARARSRGTSTRAAPPAGKRVQCQGGAKNPVVILPDADLTTTSEIVADSAFGCAGQRCLASSVAIAVGEAAAPFTDAMRDRASGTGDGLRARRRRPDGAGDHARRAGSASRG